MPWNPERYLQFRQERFAPFDDLLALIPPRPNLSVLDLGCGTGELTARLAGALPGSRVLGIDTSGEMLDKAEQYAGPNLRFERASLLDMRGPWDVVFSHAAIQWVDDHRSLIPYLLSLVARGGRLAVQMPANHGHPSHIFIRQTADEEPFRTALGGWSRPSPVLTPEEYADLLYDAGGRDLAVLLKVYPHVLADAGAIADWTSGTALVPYFERLPDDLHEPFVQRYRARLQERYPQRPVFYGFQRILFAATREE